MTPNEKLVNLLARLRGPELTNKLMRLADRQLALAMMYMEEPDRNSIFRQLSAAKVSRLKAEIALHERLQVGDAQYRIAIDQVIRIIDSEQKNRTLKSYLKPRRAPDRKPRPRRSP